MIQKDMIFSRGNFVQPSAITSMAKESPKQEMLFVYVIIESGGYALT